jgi:Flp pilus assembly protein TadD
MFKTYKQRSNANMNQIKDLVEKAKILLEENKFEEALGFFEQALLMNQNDPELWNHKGVALRSMGRYDEALECFNKSLELDPRDKNAS